MVFYQDFVRADQAVLRLESIVDGTHPTSELATEVEAIRDLFDRMETAIREHGAFQFGTPRNPIPAPSLADIDPWDAPEFNDFQWVPTDEAERFEPDQADVEFLNTTWSALDEAEAREYCEWLDRMDDIHALEERIEEAAQPQYRGLLA